MNVEDLTPQQVLMNRFCVCADAMMMVAMERSLASGAYDLKVVTRASVGSLGLTVLATCMEHPEWAAAIYKTLCEGDTEWRSLADLLVDSVPIEVTSES